MELVRLINNGDAQVKFMWAGREYLIDPGGGEVVISEAIAKRWLGDWDLKGENEIAAEMKRLKKLHGIFPNPDIKIKVEKVLMVKRTTEDEAKDKIPKRVNPYVDLPEDKEKEFEDLKNIESKEEDMNVEEEERPMDWSSRNADEVKAEKEAIEKKKRSRSRSK